MGRKIKFFAASALVAASFLLYLLFNLEFADDMKASFTFYNATSAPPDSFDPLDFDSANNVFLARLMYATPLEFDQSGVLTSSVLEEFSYDKASRTLRFKLKPNLKFHDGSLVTTSDLAMAIKRMAYFRPKFPVIEKIKGLAAWRAGSNAFDTLPEGMEITGQELKISYTDDIPHPLFRFTLELFAIIPSAWIDSSSGKMRNGMPPESGPYRLASGKLKSPEWTFELRDLKRDIPTKIEMNFYPWDKSIEFAKSKEGDSCVGGFGEIFLDPKGMKKISEAGLKIVTTPNAWHMVMKLNSTESAFRDQELRKAFISRLRTEMLNRYPKGIRLEESIFTRLLEGYVDYRPENPTDLSEDLKTKFSKAFSNGLVWVGKEMHLPAVDDALAATCTYFGISCSKIARSESAGKPYDLFVGLTGFWSYDPYGDIKMLFTPNLHKQLQDVASDSDIQTMLSQLNDVMVTDKASLAKDLDRYIHDKYIYNVVAHFPFVFAYTNPKATGQGIPQSGTLPYPWMLAQ